jgi:glyoxylase-like metal-dependent hydrolase (beta-lactamase superfamily II)
MPTLTRRTWLALTGAAALAPRAAFTAERVTLGGLELVTLSDGSLSLPAGFFFDAVPQEELAALAPELGLDLSAPLTPPCNVTLLRSGDRVVLFDCGAGPAFMASAGRLGQALETEGLAPDDVTDIVFTHAHPDHLWGVLDDFDEILFRNAAYHMGRDELAYWSNPETVNTIGEARASFAAGATRRLDAISGAMSEFGDGDEVLPGVTAVLTPGHTPGHMSFVVTSGGDSAMIIGDAIGNEHVAMARPDWPSGADQDMETGRATRVRLLDRLAADEMIAVGFHMGGGGIGRVERLAEGYRFVTDL